MGNRAVVVFADQEFKEFSPAVYLHWNGGLESIVGFMDEMERRGIRGDFDLGYQCAGFISIVNDFFAMGHYGFLDKSGQMISRFKTTGTGLQKVRGSNNLSLGVHMFDPEKDWDILDPGDNGVFIIIRTWKDQACQVAYFRRVAEEFVKVDPAEVKAAEQHEYRAGFRKDFLEDRPYVTEW